MRPIRGQYCVSIGQSEASHLTFALLLVQGVAQTAVGSSEARQQQQQLLVCSIDRDYFEIYLRFDFKQSLS